MKDLRARQTTKKESPKESENGEKKSWKEKLAFKILFCLFIIGGAIVVITMELGYILDCDILGIKIYWLGLAAVAIYRAIRWYLGISGWETLAKVMKSGIISAVLLLPLVAGIAGYGREHYLAWKNETFQKNETAKAERERAQGMEAEIIRDISVDGKKIEKGKILPLVLVGNSIQEKQNGPYRLIQVYLPDQSSDKLIKAWVSLEDAVPRPKTLHFKGHDKNFDLSGKVLTITFKTDGVVSVLDDFKIGQKVIISGAPEGELKWPNINNSSSILIFSPFWFLETMMAYSDRVGWTRFYQAMTTYRMGGIYFKAILAYSVAFMIFLVGNLGIRIIALKGIFSKIMNFTKVTFWELFFMSIIFLGLLFPMFFLQKGTPWNTIQFFYYSLFFLAILAGIEIGTLLEKSKAGTAIFVKIALILLVIPSAFSTSRNYLPSRPPAKLDNSEIEALNFLSKEPDGVVLTYPFDKEKSKEAESYPPRPLYLYESTAYVSAFSGKSVFLEDEINLNITGYDWRERRKAIENWYQESDQFKAREFLRANNISYIYWLKNQRAYLGEGQLGLNKIFENNFVIIYRSAI